MNLQDINEALNHKIIGGSEYGWECYPDARYLDYESEYAHCSVLFNINTQEIYCAEVNTKELAHQYRWLNPMYIDAMVAEATQKNIDPNQAWDDVKWTDLEVEEDFLEKATALFNGDEFDTRIQVPLDLDDDLIVKLALEAHKRDITLNQMVEEILRNMIAKYERDGILEGYEQDQG